MANNGSVPVLPGPLLELQKDLVIRESRLPVIQKSKAALAKKMEPTWPYKSAYSAWQRGKREEAPSAVGRMSKDLSEADRMTRKLRTKAGQAIY